MISPSDFDWRDPEAVTVREQMAIAVYTNVNGAIVIRQKHAWDEDADTIILIQPDHARTVAAAIFAEAGIDAAIAPPTPKDPSGRTSAQEARKEP